ncbi:MAG: tetratricopeptide repeat protein [Rikenellaceae bacterium]|nr:tetratricopeptide repeat protein [Rikenellaceae bacterium]
MRPRLWIYILVTVTVASAAVGEVRAQKYPERRNIREGNRNYERARYEESETDYRRALEQNPESFEAGYNLGNSLYKQGRWEDAEGVFSRLSKVDTSEGNLFDTHFNAGNAMFQQRKLEEALEHYKEALRIAPGNEEAKFNYAYVKKMLEKDDENNDGGGGGGGGNDDNPDGGGGEGNDNQNDGGGGDNDPGDGENDGEGQDNPRNGQGNRHPGMTRNEAEALLEAMQNNEDRTREKMEEKKARTVQRSEKNW